MKTLILLVVMLGMGGCAQTVFYRDGKPIARFQGDMTAMRFSMDKDGAVTWESSAVSHSVPTTAQGTAAANKISAFGIAAATAGVATLVK